MRKLIWGLALIFIQNWVLRKLSPTPDSIDPRSGTVWVEFVERALKRMIVFVFTAMAVGLSSLIGLYFILQSVRLWLEQSLGWEPLAVTALFAMVFVGLTTSLVLGYFKVPVGGPKTQVPAPVEPAVAWDR